MHSDFYLHLSENIMSRESAPSCEGQITDAIVMLMEMSKMHVQCSVIVP